MKKIKATVVETMVVRKEVEIKVLDGATVDEIDDAIREEAYKTIITDADSGWKIEETLDVDIVRHKEGEV